MNKFIAIGCIAACSVAPALADDHGEESMGNGAFTTLFVSAKDVESYINSVMIDGNDNYEFEELEKKLFG